MKPAKFKMTELGPIPEDWEVKRIGECGKLLRDTINPQVFPDQVYYEYSMPNYDDGRIPRAVLGKSLFSNKTSIQGEVLLFNKLNVRKRRIWYVKEALPNAICSSEFLPYYSRKSTFVSCRIFSPQMCVLLHLKTVQLEHQIVRSVLPHATLKITPSPSPLLPSSGG